MRALSKDAEQELFMFPARAGMARLPEWRKGEPALCSPLARGWPLVICPFSIDQDTAALGNCRTPHQPVERNQRASR